MRYPWYKVREGNLLRQRKELRALAPQGDHAPVAVAAEDVRQAFRWEGLFVFLLKRYGYENIRGH